MGRRSWHFTCPVWLSGWAKGFFDRLQNCMQGSWFTSVKKCNISSRSHSYASQPATAVAYETDVCLSLWVLIQMLIQMLPRHLGLIPSIVMWHTVIWSVKQWQDKNTRNFQHGDYLFHKHLPALPLYACVLAKTPLRNLSNLPKYRKSFKSCLFTAMPLSNEITFTWGRTL